MGSGCWRRPARGDQTTNSTRHLRARRSSGVVLALRSSAPGACASVVFRPGQEARAAARRANSSAEFIPRSVPDAATPGRYEAQHIFNDGGAHLGLVRLDGSHDVAAVPIDVEGADAPDIVAAGPNYLFVGTLFSLLAITIVTVAIMRLQERATGRAQASYE